MQTIQTSGYSWLKTTPIAHRGLHSNDSGIPENSLTAFENAIKHDYAIELDVHVTSAGEIAVFHDENLNRMCGIGKSIYTLSADDRKHCKLLKTNDPIPLLQDVFDLVNGRVPILIEIKRQQVKNANRIILNALSAYKGPIAIQSFDPFTMRWFAANAPSIVRGQLSSYFKHDKMNAVKKFLLKNLKFNFISKPHFIAYDVNNLPNRLIERKRKEGILILGWTVTSRDVYERVRSCCDNIIFEGFMP